MGKGGGLGRNDGIFGVQKFIIGMGAFVARLIVAAEYDFGRLRDSQNGKLAKEQESGRNTVWVQLRELRIFGQDCGEFGVPRDEFSVSLDSCC